MLNLVVFVNWLLLVASSSVLLCQESREPPEASLEELEPESELFQDGLNSATSSDEASVPSIEDPYFEPLMFSNTHPTSLSESRIRNLLEDVLEDSDQEDETLSLLRTGMSRDMTDTYRGYRQRPRFMGYSVSRADKRTGRGRGQSPQRTCSNLAYECLSPNNDLCYVKYPELRRRCRVDVRCNFTSTTRVPSFEKKRYAICFARTKAFPTLTIGGVYNENLPINYSINIYDSRHVPMPTRTGSISASAIPIRSVVQQLYDFFNENTGSFHISTEYACAHAVPCARNETSA